jgi:hypothetical protein
MGPVFRRFDLPGRRDQKVARAPRNATTSSHYSSLPQISATYGVRKIDRQIIPDEKEFPFFPH